MRYIFFKTFIIFILLFTYGFSNTLKIVYNPKTPPLKFTDSSSKPNGMLIDIWKYWAKKNNIDVVFIEAPWDETINMIKDKRADIHAGIYYTKDRDKFLDYQDQPLYENKNYFFYNKKFLRVKSKADLKPFVIGTGNGYSNEFMGKLYKQYAIKSYKSDDALSYAFLDGEVKVALSSMAAMTYFIQKNNYDMDQFKYSDKTYAYTKKYYGAVKKGNKELLSIINKGFDNITQEELKSIEQKWTIALSENYLKDHSYNNIALSKDQKEYLYNKKEIKLCVDPKWLPFEAISDGKHKGIVGDIFKEFQEYFPIPINLIQTQTWDQSLEFIKQKKCYIMAAAAMTPSREKYLNFTRPYLKFPEVIATNEDEPFIEEFESIIHKKIGVVKNSAINELIKRKYPNINLIDVDSVSDGLMQVSQGKLYGFINTSAAISYYISKEGMTNLKIAAKVGIDYHLRVAIQKDEPMLLDIFNIIINNLDKNKINSIKEHWLKVKVQEIIDYSIIYKTIAFFILIILIILYWNRKLNEEISQREKIQKELDKFSQVIEQSMVSVIITDLNGIIQYVNPFCLKQVGYEKQEILGQTPSLFKSGYQNEDFYANLWNTIKAGKTWQGEFSNKRKNGEIYWESAIIAPIFDKYKNISFFASIKEDITDKVIARENLQLAQEEAIKANSAKSEFLAKMSHEIRTPMNAVLGMLYLLEKTEVSSIQQNYIKKANYAANSLLGIINDILDFSKIEAGKLDINNEDFEFNDMIMDVLSVMSFKAEEKNLELLAYYDNKIAPFIISDKLRIEQILNNLISNAIKFTQKGEVVLSTKLLKQDDENIEILFCVKDSGIGISNEAQTNLFEEFSQIDNSATRAIQGTGLGLAISKKLSNLLGGDIWIEESKEGVGSTFCFNINCKKSDKKLSRNISNSYMKDFKCLVVDDNISAQDILSKMLVSFGYEVDVASCGKDAIKLIKSKKYDMVFLDYKMPGMNGIETYKVVQNDLQNNKTKTIIVSAYSKDIMDEDIKSLGIQGYLSKPISPSNLYNKIFEVQNPIVCNENIKLDSVIKYFDGAKVLLVEDNELNQEFATHMLQDRGFNVDIAYDGIEALSLIRNKKYDLVLMDIQMPHMDGLEATTHIRRMEDDYFKKIPIIALSANALLGDKEKSINAGMDEHINKPIDPVELFEVIGKYIDSKDKVISPKQKEQGIKQNNINTSIFDVENTLVKLNNSYDVYIKILKQFSINYRDIYNIIQKYVKQKDIKILSSKIHEIKGVSGNIGAFKLYDKLVIMDRLVKKGDIPTLILLEEFKSELDCVLKEIDKLGQKQISQKHFDKQKVIKLLQKIYENLEEDIVVCEELLEEVNPYLNEEYEYISKQLTDSLSGFDIENTKSIIKSFLEEIN